MKYVLLSRDEASTASKLQHSMGLALENFQH